MKQSDITAASIVFMVWVIVSLAILAVLVIPYILPHDLIGRAIPACEWQTKYGKECLFCGMTTSFYLISAGDFPGALSANQISLPLYFLFLVNEIIFAGVLLKYTVQYFIKNNK